MTEFPVELEMEPNTMAGLGRRENSKLRAVSLKAYTQGPWDCREIQT